jgi:hypothetical protein
VTQGLSQKWSVRQSLRAESRTISITLEKGDCSIAIVFPRPAGWASTGPEEYRLIRELLAEATKALEYNGKG